MKYTTYKNLDLTQINREILAFWKNNQIFEQSVNSRENQPAFVFYEGPPSANGMPGIHHVMARTVKDLFCRYKTLKGFQVKRKGGWDTHGLPIELQVEKELGITKDDIGKKISIAEYNQKCRESVMRFKEKWDELTEKMGYWVDLQNPYITFENEYIESIWALLKRLYEKGLLYKGYTIQPYSPGAGTGLSSHELNLPGCYKMVKDTSVTAMFKVKNNEKSSFLFADNEEDVRILAWTTTPWTLPSNMALTIGKHITYQKVRTFNPYTFAPVTVILAKEVVKNYFSEKAKDVSFEQYKQGDKVIPYQIIGEFSGEKLMGVQYEQLIPAIKPEGKAFEVIAADFVTTEDGTGVVHTSPTFGADDFRAAAQYGISGLMAKDENGKDIPTVMRQGQFVPEIQEFFNQEFDKLFGKERLKPQFIKPEYEPELASQPNYVASDVVIATYLKNEGKAFKVEKYEHNYPHCWRTDKPVLYYPLDSWFIKTTAAKDKMVELNKTINWKPESTGTGRFGNWLENLVDWNLSRSRYWGTPLPIWRTEDGTEEKCIGSVEELCEEIYKAQKAGLMKENSIFSGIENTGAKATGKDGKEKVITLLREFILKPDYDLHRPYVDEIILVSDSGQPMKRETDLIDVWFDSGAMPYAQWGFPIKNQEVFKANYPADYIAEGVDQTRGWFFTLHAIAVMLFDSIAFKNVISNGLVLDKDGNKMSKRLGNAVNPFEAIDKYGTDAIRWYMITNASPWENLKFNFEILEDYQRKFFGTLYNTYSFFALYANLDNFTYAEPSIPLAERQEADRWILSKLNSLIREVENAYEDYEPTKAARAILEFTTDDLSNWYVRLNRKRFWKSEKNTDKLAAFQTLYDCLLTIAKLASPIIPFYADRLYQDLNKVSNKETHSSVHLSFFPNVEVGAIDAALEQRMKLAQSISSLGHAIRKGQKIKVRQPLSKILIPVRDAEQKSQIQAVEDLILAEINVKEMQYLEDDATIVVKKAKANFKKLGKQYGKFLQPIANAISNLTNEEINRLEKNKELSLAVENQAVSLTLEDVEITSQDIAGWAVARDQEITIALDLTISESLRLEGIARDIVNRVQNIRKDQDFEVTDKIKLLVEQTEPLITQAVQTHQDYICQETQTVELSFAETLNGNSIELDLDDWKVKVKVEKV